MLEKLGGSEQLQLADLLKHWEEIAGAQIALVTSPLNINDGVIIVEVLHSAWLQELRGPTAKLIIDNINRICGETFCQKLRFVPAGKQPEKWIRNGS